MWEANGAPFCLFFFSLALSPLSAAKCQCQSTPLFSWQQPRFPHWGGRANISLIADFQKHLPCTCSLNDRHLKHAQPVMLQHFATASAKEACRQLKPACQLPYNQKTGVWFWANLNENQFFSHSAEFFFLSL